MTHEETDVPHDIEESQTHEPMSPQDEATPTPSAEDASYGQSTQAQLAARPEGLPDKFWDASRNEVRAEALYKSYRELEHRFSGLGDKSIPESHEGYEIDAPLSDMRIDPEVNARLHEAGFSQRQAQLVYDLAAEYLGPLSESVGAEVAAEMAAENDRRRLRDHFGGEARWTETAAQPESWGRAKLGDKAVNELSSSFEGVLRLHKMMQTDEPSIIAGDASATDIPNEAALKELMRDPRYWRDHDAAYVKKIKSGFEALYPESD